MTEEILQLTWSSAQKRLKATLPQKETTESRTELRKLSLNAGYKLHWLYRNLLRFCTHKNIWMRNEGDIPVNNDGNNTKIMPRRPSNPQPTRHVLRRWDERQIDERKWRRHMPNIEWEVVCMDRKSLTCANDSTLSRKSRESIPFLSKCPRTVSDKNNQEVPYLSGNAKDPRESPYTLQQEVQISDSQAPDLQLDWKPTIIKTAWYWHTRHPCRCKEENGEPRKKDSLSKKEGGVKASWWQGSLGNAWSWGTWTTPCWRITLDSFFVPPTTRTSQQIDYCNIKFEVRPGLEKPIGSTLLDLSLRTCLMDWCHQERETEEQERQLGLQSTKSDFNGKCKACARWKGNGANVRKHWFAIEESDERDHLESRPRSRERQAFETQKPEPKLNPNSVCVFVYMCTCSCSLYNIPRLYIINILYIKNLLYRISVTYIYEAICIIYIIYHIFFYLIPI